MVTRNFTKFMPICFYFCLALLIMLPLLLPGFVLALDLVFTPKMHLPLSANSLFVIYGIIKCLNTVLPGDIVEKVILLAIITLAGLGMFRLIKGTAHVPRYSAGLLYAINPFTYSRLMSGQYLVLAGYAFLPWYINSLFTFIGSPNKHTALKLSLWGLGIGIVSSHFLGFAALASVTAIVIALVKNRKLARPVIIWSSAVLAAILLLNSFWLIPALLGHSSQSSLVTTFTDRYFLSFHTIPDPHFGQVFNTLSLYGFWGDAQHIYTLPKTAVPWWWATAIILLIIAAIGVFTGWRKRRTEISLMLVLGAAGLVLAQGIMGSPFAEFNYWLMQHVWIYRAYREPGKFIALIALALCYLFGLGVDWILSHFKPNEWGSGLVAGAFIALPFAYTPTILWGGAGQLHAVDYPPDWYALNHKLDTEQSSGKILFLPWHQYMYFSFAGRVIANPATRFFDRPTIQGDNAEIGLIEYQSQSPLSRTIQTQILSPTTGQQDLGPRLHRLGIEYVVLAKEQDFQNYSWLDRMSGLTITSESKTLKVYKVVP